LNVTYHFVIIKVVNANYKRGETAMSFDYISKLYEQLTASREHQDYIKWTEAFNDNLQSRDYDKLFLLLKDTDIIWKIRHRVDAILKEIVRELIGDESNLSIVAANNCVSISYSPDIPPYEYKKNYWASPPADIVKIDFRKKKITVFDGKQEFEKADRIVQKNLSSEKEELQRLKDKLDKMLYDTSKKHMLKEIRSHTDIISFLFFAVSTCFSSAKNKKLKKIYNVLIEKQRKLCRIQEEKVKRISAKNYMAIFDKIQTLQSQILEKLKPLEFETETEKITYDADESSEELWKGF